MGASLGGERAGPGERLIFTSDGLGPGGNASLQYEAQWWMHRATREFGRTAIEAANLVFRDSCVVDYGSMIAVDIDA